MDNQELKFILQSGEGLKIEFKESFDKSISKEIIAFANSNGGRIFLGINDSGAIKGLKITNKLKSQIQDIAKNCDPAIKIKLEEFKNILIIEVKEGTDKPYKCSSGFYLRQGANSQKMTRDEIRKFFNREGKILFDEMVSEKFSFRAGFDKSKFNLFLEKAKISKVIPAKDILKNIGILNDENKFKNAGVLFFCRKIEKFIPQAIITCVLYKGKDKVFIIDKKDFAEDLYLNYQNSVDFLYRNLKLRYEIKGFGPRKEILEIPEEALKEALVNALAHRDYMEKGANILVEIYDDRVEITNPGGLVSGVKKSEFGKKSLSRNPLLFSLFKRVDLVEKVGSGIIRMRRAMKTAGLPLPKFAFTDFFTITFYRSKESIETVKKGVEKVVRKGGQKRWSELTKKQQIILLIIKENPKISRKELVKELNINPSAVQKRIEKLKQKNLLKRIGPAKGGHWEITR